MSYIRVTALALAAGAVLVFGGGPTGRVPHVAAVTGISLTPIASGLTLPTAISNAGDSRLFIVEQSGEIRIYDPAATPTLRPTPFLDVSGLISGGTSGTERGLLGLAFHPGYASNGLFYIDYTGTNGDVVIAQYQVSADPNVANPSGTPLLTIPHTEATNHNGGQLAFGPDGMLYIAVGDGGDTSDAGVDAQNLDSLLGKILRIDVTGAPPYTIPAGNPFAGDPNARDEIWAYGLRNPWRFSFDRSTGDLLIADVGETTYEEMDFQPAGSAGGQNYGWRRMEGAHCYNPATGCNTGGMTMPSVEYTHDDGNCSISGGYRYRGAATGFAGTYVYGDFCSGRIWGATRSGSQWTSSELLDTSFFISTFGEGSTGELYLADYFGGTIQRLNVLDSDTDGVPDASDNCPLNANPGQENNDRNFIDQTPPRSVDDVTLVMSDNLGDACDPDDDNDTFTDAQEAAGAPCASASAATDPLLADTDSDLTGDAAECALGTNPNDANSKPPQSLPAASDADHDALSDAFETQMGFNPNNADSDADGLRDGAEYKSYGSSPSATDSDGDGVRDDCEATSLNMDTKTNPGDQALLASEMLRTPPPPKLPNFDINKDGALNPGDQALQANRATPGMC
jgi:glucose/arabinose dehydrogenase